ncbi:MAG: hypothetical protein P1S60_18780 [Anaerolineae bacterium]|nr:hypothetical protein [Anaerolineae bacterium]
MFDHDDHDAFQEDLIFLEDEEVDYYEYGDPISEGSTDNNLLGFVIAILLFAAILIMGLILCP